jgi:hypothetical protein
VVTILRVVPVGQKKTARTFESARLCSFLLSLGWVHRLLSIAAPRIASETSFDRRLLAHLSVQSDGGGEYTEEGLKRIVRYPECSDEDLARLPERDGATGGGVHHAMHYYHLGLNYSGLSQLMLSRLRQGGWTCPVCGESFPHGVDPRTPR